MIRLTKQASAKAKMMTGITLLVMTAALLSLAAFSNQAVANPARWKTNRREKLEERL